MKIPRNISGVLLVKKLRLFGYVLVRQDGSHLRLTTKKNGEHHVTIPNHSPIKVGTLNGILKAVAIHHDFSVEEILDELSF